MARDDRIDSYDGPAGGWGSAKSVARALIHDGAPLKSAAALTRQNKPGGFACVSCAWSKPRDPLVFEFCENGAKATGWELTSKTIGAEFFARHTLSELATWSDVDLEYQGRLTEPLRLNPATDRYEPRASASRSAPCSSRISTTQTACCSSARTSARTRPTCCIRCRRRAGAARRSSPSIR